MADRIEIGALGWTEAHVALYRATNGSEGHLLDFSAVGGPPGTPCLILRTVGRRTGETKLIPLIYGQDGERFIIVASKGGAAKHPAWYLNIAANPNVAFQVADKKFAGKARTAVGEERARLFTMMAGVFPPYNAYQARTDREIPVVVLEPLSEIETL